MLSTTEIPVQRSGFLASPPRVSDHGEVEFATSSGGGMRPSLGAAVPPQSSFAGYNGCHLVNGSHPRRWTVIFSGLLCGALALVVIYTNRGGLSSPLAIVVLAAIGLLALILQLRLREPRAVHAPVWLNVVGILFALGALGSDLIHIRSDLSPILALLAVACFAVSAASVLQVLRREPRTPEASEQKPN
jgi:hypothetical protein